LFFFSFELSLHVHPAKATHERRGGNPINQSINSKTRLVKFHCPRGTLWQTAIRKKKSVSIFAHVAGSPQNLMQKPDKFCPLPFPAGDKNK
jgi:hypothetical protein